jgi:hypothetical protein
MLDECMEHLAYAKLIPVFQLYNRTKIDICKTIELKMHKNKIM